MRVVPLDQTPVRQVRSSEYRAILRDYVGKVGTIHEGPTVFSAQMPDQGATVRPHFHDVDQFQVFFDGEGVLGKHPVGPFDFHYADAYTAYGPIVAGRSGLSMLTVRAGCASGYFPMPGSRHLALGRPGRNLKGKFEVATPAAGATDRASLLAPQDDGLRVVAIRLPSDTDATGEPADAGDQFCLVCEGSLRIAGESIDRFSIVHVEAGDPAPRFRSGPTGAAILVLQLPRPTSRAGSDVRDLAKRCLSSYQLPEGAVIGPPD